VIPPGDEVAVYEITAEPLFEEGAPKITVALRLPVAVATTEVGVVEMVMVGAQPEIVLLPSPAFERLELVSKVPQY
jgi:hypothetical protein